jgi:hypothetical protein
MVKTMNRDQLTEARIDIAIAGVLGWFIDDRGLPADVREDLNALITASRKWAVLRRDFPTDEQVEAAAKAIRQIRLDINPNEVARAALEAVTPNPVPEHIMDGWLRDEKRR